MKFKWQNIGQGWFIDLGPSIGSVEIKEYADGCINSYIFDRRGNEVCSIGSGVEIEDVKRQSEQYLINYVLRFAIEIPE